MLKILCVISGGALGSLLRYLTSSLMQKIFIGVFPIGTFTVNLTGSFIIGLLWVVAESSKFQENYRLFIFTGVLGGFTTFSSLSIETLNLFRDSQIKTALLYIFATNIFGVLLALAGVFMGKQIYGFMR